MHIPLTKVINKSMFDRKMADMYVPVYCWCAINFEQAKGKDNQSGIINCWKKEVTTWKNGSQSQ